MLKHGGHKLKQEMFSVAHCAVITVLIIVLRKRP